MTDTSLLDTLPPLPKKKPLPKKLVPKRKLMAQQYTPRMKVNEKGQIILKEEMDHFLEEFIRNGGNATQAALTVKKTASISEAAALGTNYLKQAKALGRIYMEKQGYGYGKLLDVALEKMTTSDRTEWWDRIMKLNDYHDFVSKEPRAAAPVNVNVIQTHKNLTSEYIEADEAETVDED